MHTLAAEQLITNLDAYIEFLRQVKDWKANRTFTNLEKNLWDALHDPPTLEELATLAVYSQCVSVPYVAHIRSNPDLNALDMGPYYQSILTFCQSIIDDPNLVLGENAFDTPATLGGGQFHRPEVMYAIHRLAPGMPHLRPLIQ